MDSGGRKHLRGGISKTEKIYCMTDIHNVETLCKFYSVGVPQKLCSQQRIAVITVLTLAVESARVHTHNPLCVQLSRWLHKFNEQTHLQYQTYFTLDRNNKLICKRYMQLKCGLLTCSLLRGKHVRWLRNVCVRQPMRKKVFRGLQKCARLRQQRSCIQLQWLCYQSVQQMRLLQWRVYVEPVMSYQK